MRAVAIAALLLVAGCYDPDYPVNIACSERSTCPPDQRCSGGFCRTDSFSPVDAAGPVIDAGMCTLVPQTGCSLADKCSLIGAEGRTGCTPVGTMEIGAACTLTGYTDDCTRGNLCIFRECTNFCRDGGDCTGEQVCVPIGTATVTYFRTCLQKCNPLASMPCPLRQGSAQGCYLVAGTPSCGMPSPMNPPGLDAACTFSNNCAPETTCVNGFCRKYCNYAASPGQQGTCPSMRLCQRISNEDPGLGGCVPP